METDRYRTSSRARRAMLHAVYEDNRRIVDDEHAARGRRRRRAGGAGLIVAAIGIAAVVFGSDQRRPPSGQAMPAWGVVMSELDLPEIDTTDASEALVAQDELRALVDQPTPLAQLFGLSVRTVVLDPGHGGRDPGAVSPGGLYEKDVALDVATRLRRRLEAQGYRVVMTREGDETVSLRDRVDLANRVGTDLFVSLHVNTFPADSINVLETYYFGADSHPRSLTVAEVENDGSDFSLADFNALIGEVVTTVKLQESRRLARAVQRSLFGNARSLGVPVENWGTKAGPFVVLLGSQAPSVLAEIGVLSHPDDERRLATGAHREQLAMFLEEGILHYLISRSRGESGAETVN